MLTVPPVGGGVRLSLTIEQVRQNLLGLLAGDEGSRLREVARIGNPAELKALCLTLGVPFMVNKEEVF